MKYLSIVSVLIVLTMGSYWVRGTHSRQSKESHHREVVDQDLLRPTSEGPVTIEVLAKRAKAKGLTRVYYPEGLGMRPHVADFEEAKSRFSILVIKPIEKVGWFERHLIGTVFKVKILEAISKRQASKCCLPSSSVTLPTLEADDDAYFSVGGGSVIIEGVEVVQTGGLSNLELNQTYLIFGNHDQVTRSVNAPLGASGVWRIVDDRLTRHPTGSSVSQEETAGRLHADLESRFAFSVRRLAENIKSGQGQNRQ